MCLMVEQLTTAKANMDVELDDYAPRGVIEGICCRLRKLYGQLNRNLCHKRQV